MQDRLHQLGWREIDVVDEDLGRSAAGMVTRAAPIADRHFAPAQDGESGLTTDLVERWAGALGGYRLVLVNGAYAPQFSVGGLPAGVHVSSLRSILATNPAAVEPYLGRFAPPDRQSVTALNTGYLQDGAFVWIPP